MPYIKTFQGNILIVLLVNMNAEVTQYTVIMHLSVPLTLILHVP